MDLERKLDKMVTAEIGDWQEDESVKKFTSMIHSDLLNNYMECGVCSFKETPDIVGGHMLERHNYTVGEVQKCINYWQDHNFEWDENGNPALMCTCGEHFLVRDGCSCD